MKKGYKKIFSLLAVFSLLLIVITSCTKTETPTTDGFKDGEYTVETKGMENMKMKVTFSGEKITNVEILEHSETDGIADEALVEIPKRIVDQQSLSVDVISGATITSEGIIEGVKKAITEAGGDPAKFSQVTTPQEIAFKAGTYTGEAEGHNGKLVVDVEVSEDEILSVTIKEDAETKHLSSVVYERIPKQIVADQSLTVDLVVGATVTSSALKNAVADAVKKAGVDPQALNKPSKTVLSTEVKEVSADVVVVGGGSAGITAALTAQQEGKSVIILEKTAMYGGHTALSGGWTLITGSKAQEERGITNDTTQSAYDDIMANGGNNSDPDMLRLFVDNMGEAADWTIDYAGAKFPETLKVLPENAVDRAIVYEGGGIGLIDALVNKMNETDIDQYLETRAEELIVEDGKVVGVIAKSVDGTTYHFKADAIILATGGHGARRDLLGDVLDNYVYYGAALASGDGVDLGTSVGADTTDMSFVEIFENGVEWKPGIAKSTFNGSMAAWETGGILVDRSGNRVVNEKGMGPEIVEQQAKQEDARLFLFMDQSTFDAFRENIGGYGITDEMLDAWLENNAKDKPYFAHGETIEEVAAILNIDADNLKATMERYNTFVRNGNDEDFGRDAKYMTQEIGEGPYYLVEQLPRYATTLGGLKVNTDLQVLNTDGSVIEGLYAVGDTAAGVRGDNSISGSDVAWAVTSGYIVGKIVGK